MGSISIYLNFNGQTEEAFEFYKSAFGGEFRTFTRFGDTGQAAHIPADDHHKMMHVALPLLGGHVLMGTDILESLGQSLTIGNNSYICISPDSKEEAMRLFESLSDGAIIEMPLQDTFWGAYYGILKDKFGIQWMVNYEVTVS